MPAVLPSRHWFCTSDGMGVRHFTELAAWQLAAELRDRIVALSASGPLSLDRDLCDQLRRAAASAPANIAEGFGRFEPRDFCRFLRIARASLFETQNHLDDARRRSLLVTSSFDECWTLSLRALGATTRLLQSLESRQPPRNRHA
jgi:four helix bundle protein